MVLDRKSVGSNKTKIVEILRNRLVIFNCFLHLNNNKKNWLHSIHYYNNFPNTSSSSNQETKKKSEIVNGRRPYWLRVYYNKNRSKQRLDEVR